MISGLGSSSDSILVSWGLALIIFLQNPPWPLWNCGLLLGYFLSLILIIYINIKKRNRYLLQGMKQKRFPIFYFSLIFLLIIPLVYGLKLSSVFIFITYILLFRVTQNDLKHSLTILTNIIAYVILFTLPFWVFHVFITELPSFGEIDITEMKGREYILDNHILFLTYRGFDFFRFYSVFDEPGVLGTLSAFIIFGNRYNFKQWQNIVIFIGGIFTYSMAFYVLFLLGYFYYNTYSLKHFVKSFFFLICTIPIVFFLLKDDLAFSLSVVERFKDFGLNRIENRTGEEINRHLSEMFYSPTIFWGEGTSFLQRNRSEVGASYKLFIIEYGVMGLLGLFLMYFSLLWQKNRDTLFFLFLFSLSFLQRPYAFTAWQLTIFAAVVASLSKNMEYD